MRFDGLKDTIDFTINPNKLIAYDNVQMPTDYKDKANNIIEDVKKHCFDVNNVAEYVDTLAGKQLKFVDLPPVKPPFNYSYYEHKINQATLGTLVMYKNFGEKKALNVIEVIMISLITSSKLETDKSSVDNAMRYINTLKQTSAIEAEELLAISCLVKLPQANFRLMLSTFFPLVKGRIVSNYSLVIPGLISGNLEKNEMNQLSTEIAGINTYTILYTLGLLNCKNIRYIDNYLPQAVQKKMIKKNLIPVNRYYTLAIEPLKERTQNKNSNDTGRRSPLHIVRGNFATYTEDKPLFGKWVGTVWREAHVRGNKDVGEITKDYQVKV